MKLITDENITPSVERDNWDLGIDTATVRGRGLLQASDAELFRLAQQEGRSIVTSNFRAYIVDMARAAETHCGVIIAPAGMGAPQQREFMRRVATWIAHEYAAGQTLKDRIVTLDESAAVCSDERTGRD